ncbi:unnamed protein product [Meloidogyne enterolobii]|uniref:Uncharacterized protein n=1 Tax=Meloidogyne enterolobii TaxID=390850 RepID=A0ACB1ANV3_MELEN
MSNQTLFDIYGDQGLPFGLITVNVVRVVISTIGVLLNASFVFVTIKIKFVLVKIYVSFIFLFITVIHRVEANCSNPKPGLFSIQNPKLGPTKIL